MIAIIEQVFAVVELAIFGLCVAWIIFNARNAVMNNHLKLTTFTTGLIILCAALIGLVFLEGGDEPQQGVVGQLK